MKTYLVFNASDDGTAQATKPPFPKVQSGFVVLGHSPKEAAAAVQAEAVEWVGDTGLVVLELAGEFVQTRDVVELTD